MQISPLAAASSSRCLHVIPTVLQQLPGMAALHHSIHSTHGNSNPNQPSTTACSQCAVPASQRTLVRSFSSKAKGGSSSSSSELVRSVRAMPIKLVSVGKGNSKAAQAMAQEWLEKLARYTTVSEVLIKPNPKGASSPQVQKDAEAEKVLKALSPGDRVVILDERGRAATSEDIARLISQAGDNGTPLAFVVGGPFGHGAAVIARADDSIRLSNMVLNHQVAYVVLLEQLYRGWTIIRGEPYHH
uniref:Uncharacterized protein n=1 Tax=Tetradesmus obliquus TaxID=3088 RepID=A0A383VJ92_TETOB|eukprot:jgi/Sobl393_1/5520/SZX64446.1